MVHVVSQGGFKISVVTALLNGGTTLRATIESVAAQDYPHIEFIVVDGGSTDYSLAIIDQYPQLVDTLLTGPDRGIGDAMNKGIEVATGEFVLFLHSDDRFIDSGALSRAMDFVDTTDVIWACDIEYTQGRGVRRVRPRPFNLWTRLKNPLPHQGVLCPRSLFYELGYFDTEFRIDMDYDFWLRAYLSGCEMRRVPVALANMGRGGISSRETWPDLVRRFDEERRVHQKHATSWLWRVIYRLYWPSYTTYRWLLSL